jgi:hypothetical protein
MTDETRADQTTQTTQTTQTPQTTGTTDNTPHVLVAGIVTESYECTINFTTTIIRIQQRISSGSASDGRCPVGFEFFSSVKSAVDHFAANAKYTRMVLLDATMGCDVDFVFRPVEKEKGIVVAAYPLRTLNMDAVSSYIETCRTGGTEPDASVAKDTGTVYNFSASKGALVDASGCVLADNPQAKIVSVSRSSLGEFVDAYDQLTSTLSGRHHVDVRTKCSNTGTYDFSGVVGKRFMASET